MVNPKELSLSDLSVKRLVALELVKIQRDLEFNSDDTTLIDLYQSYFNKISTENEVTGKMME